MNPQATISDSKEIFHKEFPYVIPPIYRKLADELLVELHLLSHQKAFKIDVLFSVGLKTLFYEFTKGYEPQKHKIELFNALCICNNLDPEEINSVAKNYIEAIKEKSVDDLTRDLSSNGNSDDSEFFYSRISAIGIVKLICSLNNANNIEEVMDSNYKDNISTKLGFKKERVDKDISLYRSNLEKMKQALELIKISNKTK